MLTDLCSAMTRFSPRTLAIEVFAYRDIQPGEELSISCKSHLGIHTRSTSR